MTNRAVKQTLSEFITRYSYLLQINPSSAFVYARSALEDPHSPQCIKRYFLGMDMNYQNAQPQGHAIVTKRTYLFRQEDHQLLHEHSFILFRKKERRVRDQGIEHLLHAVGLNVYLYTFTNDEPKKGTPIPQLPQPLNIL